MGRGSGGIYTLQNSLLARAHAQSVTLLCLGTSTHISRERPDDKGEGHIVEQGKVRDIRFNLFSN